MASGGYPGDYVAGKPITGIEEAEATPEVVVFHAGTKQVEGKLVTGGGRVLGVTALGADLAAAQAKAYEAVGKIDFEGATFRRDIAAKGL
ncbi:MAG: phosphoribosylglycinamide synthetase C domain-containing protein, partial [Verrucomicrobiota bacterium]